MLTKVLQFQATSQHQVEPTQQLLLLKLQQHKEQKFTLIQAFGIQTDLSGQFLTLKMVTRCKVLLKLQLKIISYYLNFTI